jgi:dTDP-4-amino-4,6-dideoxygalactose transaminase
MKVPYLDLAAHHAPIRGEIDAAIRKVIDCNEFAGGAAVGEFERDFAAFCRCEHTIAVGSGTEALWLALMALGVGAGDEVITVPNSFMATAEAITYCGATPVFVDVDPCTYTLNPGGLERAITPRTKAIIPVHLFGQCAAMDAVAGIARKHGLFVIEDACQAHGAEYCGRRAGTLGDAACFSFYPGKNLGAFGEAGAVVTNNAELQEKIRILRDHGQTRKYYHSMVGWNCRMDSIQAAVLKVKLQYLERANSLRRSHAAHYDRALGGVAEVITPARDSNCRHVFHIYAIRVKERDRVMRYLFDNGVGCAVHYPVAIHLQEAYRGLGYREGSFPVAERCAAEFLSLPMYPELTLSQLETVTKAVKDAVVAVLR